MFTLQAAALAEDVTLQPLLVNDPLLGGSALSAEKIARALLVSASKLA